MTHTQKLSDAIAKIVASGFPIEHVIIGLRQDMHSQVEDDSARYIDTFILDALTEYVSKQEIKED